MIQTHNRPANTLTAEFMHDLRTPLNHIIGYSEMLADEAKKSEQTGLVLDLMKIHEAGQQLVALLNKGDPVVRSAKEFDMSPAGVGLAASTSTGSPALILVVDDNKMNRDVLAQRLERQGHAVVQAENGSEAMTAVRAQAVDLVLLDIMMLEVDGYQVLTELKADDALKHIPVVMISALDELESVVRCITLGADDYLVKPFEPTLLKARIGACLEKKHAHDRVKRLFEQLEQKNARLQELEQLRDDLTHMIIHDLRTPLSSVLMGIRTVEMTGELNLNQKEMIAVAIDGAGTLMELINGLLDVEKMEAGAMELDPVLLDAKALVASAVTQIAQLAESNNLTLVQELDEDIPPFMGDENTLRRTLVNLLGNAFKFTPSGGTITVHVRHNKDEQALVFSINDTGIGIPPLAFESIFAKFGQVKPAQGAPMMGTGLGLTFCKLAVEAHGGHIEVDSVQGEGSTFTFTIPLRQTVVVAPI